MAYVAGLEYWRTRVGVGVGVGVGGDGRAGKHSIDGGLALGPVPGGEQAHRAKSGVDDPAAGLVQERLEYS